jgi:hypothetical protein
MMCPKYNKYQFPGLNKLTHFFIHDKLKITAHARRNVGMYSLVYTPVPHCIFLNRYRTPLRKVKHVLLTHIIQYKTQLLYMFCMLCDGQQFQGGERWSTNSSVSGTDSVSGESSSELNCCLTGELGQYLLAILYSEWLYLFQPHIMILLKSN